MNTSLYAAFVDSDMAMPSGQDESLAHICRTLHQWQSERGARSLPVAPIQFWVSSLQVCPNPSHQIRAQAFIHANTGYASSLPSSLSSRTLVVPDSESVCPPDWQTMMYHRDPCYILIWFDSRAWIQAALMTVNIARLLFVVLVVLSWCSDFLPQPRHMNAAMVGDPTVLLGL